jgi:hypothetical protein
MRDDASRCREAEDLRFPIDVAPRGAALDADNSALLIHEDAIHLGNIDYQAFLARRVASHAVAACANGREQTVALRKLHGVDDIGNAATARNQGGMAVEHAVED